MVRSLCGMLEKPFVCTLAALALLPGCASTSVPRDVAVAVPVACIAPADRPERPAFLSDGDILVLDSYRATWALWGERLEMLGHIGRLEAIVEGCSRLPAVRLP